MARKKPIEKPIIEEPVEVKEEIEIEAVNVTDEISKEPVEPQVKIIPNKCVVNVPRLNLRQKPDTGSLILSVLNQNEELLIVEEADDFYKVKTDDNEIGFIVKEFVTV